MSDRCLAKMILQDCQCCIIKCLAEEFKNVHVSAFVLKFLGVTSSENNDVGHNMLKEVKPSNI
jgi:hypothetical protein